MTVQEQIRRTAAHMSPSMRRIVRGAVDPVLTPVGSISGIRGDGVRMVGLTYDDGPDPVTTPAVLASLERAGTKATFFMLAERVVRYPSLVMDVVAAGHEVALHGVDHQRLTSLSPREVQERLVRGKAILQEVSGTKVRWFRSPYGAQNVGTYRAIRRAGLHSVVWTAAGKDWVDQDPADVAPRLMESLHGGGIILLHDAFACDPRETATPDPLARVRGEITMSVLETLESRGLAGTSVGSLVEAGTPHRTAWFRP
jgi:peptidoglycan/xylan/chitin deacetylase (PgdA/CDA1 family)